jgi:hypothetical protein
MFRKTKVRKKLRSKVRVNSAFLSGNLIAPVKWQWGSRTNKKRGRRKLRKAAWRRFSKVRVTTHRMPATEYKRRISYKRFINAHMKMIGAFQAVTQRAADDELIAKFFKEEENND